ncbi:PAS domain S-box protein [Maridesulfovibrio sp.]|uniref:PAS domain S-box protein n=1 Tax=Maridesulfovibrio sp. TaxID=2795000 RepID=UPI002A18B42C|nr:PAS domain S-box protein [Maridesulfovibrio sp.]
MKNTSLSIAKYLAAIFLTAILLDAFLQHQLLQRYRNDQILNVYQQTAVIRARLEKQVASNLYIIQGLANYISLNPSFSKADFDHYSQEMMYNSDEIRNVSAAPDYVVRYVHPLKGNEAFLALDCRKEPEQWEKCKQAEVTGKMIMAGPVKFSHGGEGFVGRVPVFVRGERREVFWGIVSAVIDADLLFAKSGVKSNRNLRLAIRGVDEKGASGAVFYGGPEFFNPEAKAVLQPVALASGSWEIAALPLNGWSNLPPNSSLVHLVILLLVVGGSFAAVKVVSKNAEVERSRESLNEAQSIAHLGNWSVDLRDKKIWWSNETYRIFGLISGYDVPTQRTILKRIHNADRRVANEAYRDSMKSGEPYHIDHRIVRPDGEVRYVSVQGRFDYGEDGRAERSYGTVHDITERKLIENELVESKTRFDHITKKLSSKFIFFSHTIFGEFIRLSEGFEMLGYGPPENGLGRRWSDVVNIKPESMAVALEANERVLAGDVETAEYEISYETPDGSERFLAIFGYMTFDYDLYEYVFEGVAIDITERKEREEKLKVLTRAIENAPVSVVITDTEGTISYVNPYFSFETGYSKEEAIGANPRILKSGIHDEEFYENLWNTVTSGETWRGEVANRRKDGSLYWESASISPVYDSNGKIVSYVAVKEDINDKKELEQLKNDVDLIMRHDLKTPLNGIIGLPGLLCMDDNLTEDQLRLLRIIEESGRNMLAMVEMSLDMFKMETGKYVYSPVLVDVAEIARTVVAQSRTRFTSGKVGISIAVNGAEDDENSGLLVCGEDRLIYSLFSGLLINALEASPKNEMVRISITDGDPVTISFCNKGAVPPEIRDTFFHKYVTSGKSSGTGLGTYSARLMAETMNYSISMETSDQKNETCITITVPRYRDGEDC